MAVEREQGGCVRIVADPHSLTMVEAKDAAGQHARIAVAPIAGTIEVNPTRSPGIALGVGSVDDASEVATAITTYFEDLKGKRDPAAPERARAARVRAQHPRAAEAWSMIDYALVRTPGTDPSAAEIERARTFVRNLAPESWVWGIEWEAVVLAYRSKDVTKVYVHRVLRGHADPDVRAAAAMALTDPNQEGSDLQTTRAVLAQLNGDAEASASLFAKVARSHDPDRGVRKGMPLPPLGLDDAEGGHRIDSSAWRGKVVVLHFWATWCRPCHPGIAVLETLVRTHRDDALEVVSIALDEDPSQVEKFRATNFAMAWVHARPHRESLEELAKRFEVVGSTKTIVLDAKGVVVAEHLSPTDPTFAATLADALANASASRP